jgi:hypothetical protein
MWLTKEKAEHLNFVLELSRITRPAGQQATPQDKMRWKSQTCGVFVVKFCSFPSVGRLRSTEQNGHFQAREPSVTARVFRPPAASKMWSDNRT